MGSYNCELYGMKIGSLERLMDLRIEPSFDPAIDFEVHRTEGNQWTVFWSYEVDPKIIFKESRDFIREKGMDPDHLGFIEMMENKEFSDRISGINPVFEYPLNSDETEMIRTFCENGLPECEKIPGGRDGHSYRVSVFGKEPKKYHCWCVLPKNWQALVEIVEFFVRIAAPLQPEHYLPVFR